MVKVDNIKFTGLAVFGTCILFFLYEFFLRTVIGTFKYELINDLHLSLFKFSFLSSTAYMLIYGIMQIPVSFIVDYFGLKKSLFVGAASCSIAAVGLAYSDSFILAAISRMLMGFGSSFGFICLLIAIYDWMPRKYNALFIGISQFIGTMGPLIAAGPLNALSKSTGLSWRSVFLIMGFIGLLLTILILIFVKNNHERIEKYIILVRPENVSTKFKRMFSRWQPWMIAIFSASSYFSIEYLSENEGISFLTTKGLGPNFSSSMISLAWLGYAIGCPLLGLISDLKQRRKSVLVFTAICCVISLSSIVYSNNNILLILGFFLLGIAASGQSLGFAAIADQFKKHFITIGYGINNALITSVVAINSPCISLILDSIKTGSSPNLIEYKMVFNILILMAIISLIISVFFLKESFCKSQVDFTVLKIKKSSPVSNFPANK